MDAQNEVLGRRASDQGMAGLPSTRFESVFLELAGDFLSPTGKTEVLVCGMAGAAEGWAEAGYLTVPSPPSAQKPAVIPTKDNRLSVRILPGLKQISPADVMRGEETQIAGIMAGAPDFDGVICMPGTHTKWVQVKSGVVEGFKTFMTGELFALLATSSVLRHVIAKSGWDELGFIAGLKTSHLPTSALFSLRADGLIGDMTPEFARAKLSGHLIGAEIDAAKAFWQDQKLIIVGKNDMARAYAKALKLNNAEAELIDGEALVITGLAHARKWS
ncbi:MAG: 2-dehydro-3-deoxygalactonokinase [Rhodobacteraceae bacterium]|nr:2-dehydro-3-deoxygalactonokinase [Paracoccaceae bacterium]